MGRLRIVTATRRLALVGLLLFGALSTVATASRWTFAAGRAMASRIELTVNPASADQGQTVTFTATVKFDAARAPAGTRVVFAVDRVVVASAATNASGIATFSTNTLVGGRHVVSATFAGSSAARSSSAAKRLFVGCPGSPAGRCESLLADPRPAVGAAVHPGQTLTIVATDEAPFGAHAPSALLSTGQALSVTTKATSGRRPHYVDKNGQSRGSKYQLLLRFTLPNGLAPGRYTVLVTAYAGDGDSDQWYWPIRIPGTSLPYSIDGSIATLLYPGGSPSPIDLSFTNPNPGGSGAAGVRVGRLTVKVSAVSAPAATALRPCTVSDFAVTQFSGTYPFEIPEGRSTLQSLGFAEDTWPTVRLVNRRVNQDGCKGATITLAYGGSP